jgi:hypothetical protein
MRIETEAERELARFLASQPSPDAILAFHPSPEVATRMYALIETERDGQLSEDERHELDTYLNVEHFMRMVKAAARRRLDQQPQ